MQLLFETFRFNILKITASLQIHYRLSLLGLRLHDDVPTVFIVKKARLFICLPQTFQSYRRQAFLSPPVH